MEGLSQPEVVQLLRESVGSITLVISRQEAVEKHEEDEVRERVREGGGVREGKREVKHSLCSSVPVNLITIICHITCINRTYNSWQDSNNS